MKFQKLLRTAALIIVAAGLSMNVAQAATYTDVSPSAWYYNSVEYVSSNGIMTGMDQTTFGPAQPLARAQFATILYRMAGAPGVASAPTFVDVAGGQWYTDAIAWASESGIVTGYTDTNTFQPAKSITREEIATMMHRYAKYEGQESASRANISVFPDESKVSSFSYEAMQWSVAHELVKGTNGTLNPQGLTNRAECATIIERYANNDFVPSEPSVPNLEPSVPEESFLGNKIVEYARQYVGVTPYVYGGNSLITGTDCSGFVKLIYSAFDIWLPRTTWEQDDVGIKVEEKDLKPGDLIFFQNYEHVAIYSGNGNIIHASSPTRGTLEEKLKWMGPIKTIRRVIQ